MRGSDVNSPNKNVNAENIDEAERPRQDHLHPHSGHCGGEDGGEDGPGCMPISESLQDEDPPITECFRCDVEVYEHEHEIGPYKHHHHHPQSSNDQMSGDDHVLKDRPDG